MSNPSDFRSQSADAARPDIGRDEQLSRLDQLEREIAAERERLNRTGNDPDRAERPAHARDSRDDRDRRDERDPREVRDTREVRDPRDDRDARDERNGSYARVDLPELEERVTESQREAWALGYQAGVADSESRTGERTVNPFHPLRG